MRDGQQHIVAAVNERFSDAVALEVGQQIIGRTPCVVILVRLDNDAVDGFNAVARHERFKVRERPVLRRVGDEHQPAAGGEIIRNFLRLVLGDIALRGVYEQRPRVLRYGLDRQQGQALGLDILLLNRGLERGAQLRFAVPSEDIERRHGVVHDVADGARELTLTGEVLAD